MNDLPRAGGNDDGTKLPTDTSGKTDKIQPPTGPGLTTKEREFLVSEERALEEIRRELQLPKEVERAGLEVQKEEIELPPPLPEMGVSQVGAGVPVSTPTVSLPLTDDKIAGGLSASIWASIRWLATWCLRQLKKAHMKLKKVHGRIIRVITK